MSQHTHARTRTVFQRDCAFFFAIKIEKENIWNIQYALYSYTVTTDRKKLDNEKQQFIFLI